MEYAPWMILKSTLLLAGLFFSVQAEWSNWSNFYSCSATCGYGYRYRYRSCLTAECSGINNEMKHCNMGPCASRDEEYFYYDTFDKTLWSSWSQWSECSKSCGRGGYRGRKHWCLNHMGYVVDWRKCSGPVINRQMCYGNPDCFENATEVMPVIPVRETSVVARRGNSREHFLSNDFTNGEVEATISIQTTMTTTTTTPTTTTPATTTTTTTPPTTPPNIDGGWGEWSNFRFCNMPCGEGTKIRSRLCDNPVPGGEGMFCDGEEEEEEDCKLMDCYSWSDWGEFEDCDVVCGNGSKTKWRTCEPNLEEAILRNITGTEEDCAGSASQTDECIERACRDCSIDNGNCSHSCMTNKTLPEDVCSCDSGYELEADNQTCKDINECEAPNNCEGWCINGLGSYYCFCREHNHYWDLTEHKCFEYKRPTRP